MRKRIINLLLCVCILLSAALPVNAKTKEEPKTTQFTVSNLAGFLNLAEQCRLDSNSENLVVVLKTDIDLTDVDFAGFPIFAGTFEGNGHTIKGLNITGDGSAQGLFRYLTETALVQDLNLEGEIRPGGSRSEVGAVAGNNAGTIRNCTFHGTVSGNEYVGGIAGTNAVSGIIETCTMMGNVYGSHFVGGIAGKNSGVIRTCENDAEVNDTAQENTVELADITLDSLTSSESANTVTDIGGIAGTSSGVIRDSANWGNVGYQYMGYNIGGIAGTQSGYILNCENYGEVRGRKEVGGIVGQMEPTALIEYEEDALQILQRQLNSMGSIVNSTVSNVQSTAESISGQVSALQSNVQSAKEAVNSLTIDRENPQLPDLDTIQAAKNTLSSSLSGMSQSLEGMGATTYSSMGALSNNLYALQNQINAMRTTLGNVSETMGGSITDVSDRDTEQDLTGKVERCVNHGSVLGDRNVGGIAGAMALENDLDHEDDWQLSGENSLNFESELRAVIRDCENNAVVTAKKQNAGGIVGWQSLGLVSESRSSGRLDAEGADYVGGISGQSRGYIRGCSAKSEIAGESYVGGIAGSATIATDCRSMVKLVGVTEKLGAILGWAEEDTSEEEAPIAGNLYLSVSQDIGGIDGISYSGLAEPMEREAFLAMEDLPEMFQSVTVRFLYANGAERCFDIPIGGEFPTEWIPPIPIKDGSAAVWEGLAEADLSNVTFDLTFETSYTIRHFTLQSQKLRENGLPVLLLQGSFTGDSQLRLFDPEEAVEVEDGETLIEAWHFAVSDGGTAATARYGLPVNCDGEHVRVLIRGSDNTWTEAEHTVDGSYLVFRLDSTEGDIALIQTASRTWMLAAAGGTAALVILLAVLICCKKKRKKA